MLRIAIVGTTGAGKTTHGERLAALGAPFVDPDAVCLEPGWMRPPDDVLVARVSAALSGKRWLSAGNDSRVRPIVWGRADTLVWLDYPMWVIFPRLLRCTLRRVITRQELWAGKRESFCEQFMSRNSLFYHSATTHRRRRLQFPADLARPEYSHLQPLRFRKRREVERWLEAIRLKRDGAAQ